MRVVVAVEPGDGQEVRHLPEEHDAEEDQRRQRNTPVAAVHPITGGSAPGIAPTSVASEVRSFSGV